MAALVSVASGNWSASGTWATIDPVSFLDKIPNGGSFTSSLSATPVVSASFTPGAITVDGIGVCIHYLINTSGSMTVYLDQANTPVPGTTVTVNAVDLGVADISGQPRGWVFFKFPAPVTLLAATAYTIKATGAGSSTIALTTNSTICRFLRTTTKTAVPAAADLIFIIGETTGTGTGNDIAVTMDLTTPVAFGHINIGRRGTLTYAPFGYLKTVGEFFVGGGGTFNIGSSVTPHSTPASLELACPTNVSFGFEAKTGSTINIYGVPRTIKTYISSTAFAGTSTITVDDVTGWLIGQVIVVATTSKTTAQSEKRTITNISGNVVTLDSALTFDHERSTYVKAEVINLTSNIKIFGTSATIQSYIAFWVSNLNCHYAEFFYLGSNTTNKRGITLSSNIASTANNFKSNSLHDFFIEGMGAVIPGPYNLNFSGNCVYATQSSGINVSAATIGKAIVINGNTLISCSLSGSSTDHIIYIQFFEDLTLTNNTVVGGGTSAKSGIRLTAVTTSATPVSLDGNTIHSTGGPGFSFTLANCFATINIANMTIYRVGGNGINMLGLQPKFDFTFDNLVLFGGTNYNMTLEDIAYGNLTIKNSNIFSDPAYPTAYGISLINAPLVVDRLNIINTKIVDHSNNSIYMASGYARLNVYAYNSILPRIGVANSNRLLIFASERHNQIADNYYYAYIGSTAVKDPYIFPPGTTSSMRILPYGQNVSLAIIGSYKVPCLAGQTVDASIKIRYSKTGDDAIPGGSNIGPFRITGFLIGLFVKQNYKLGYNQDTMLAECTAPANTGNWETVSGSVTPIDDGVLDFAIGIANAFENQGWINAGDFIATGGKFNTEITNDGTMVYTSGGTDTITRNVVIRRRRKIL
jgi:hypothetical protein